MECTPIGFQFARRAGPPETMDTHSVTPAQPRVPSFGISVTPYAEAYPQIVEQVLAAERTGFDLVGIQITRINGASSTPSR